MTQKLSPTREELIASNAVLKSRNQELENADESLRMKIAKAMGITVVENPLPLDLVYSRYNPRPEVAPTWSAIMHEIGARTAFAQIYRATLDTEKEKLSKQIEGEIRYKIEQEQEKDRMLNRR